MNAKRITALALALVMTLLLAACGSKTVVNDDGTKTEQTERGVKVTQTAAKAVQTEKYETADFSMTIPKGWTVTTGGTNIYHSIRVYDPAEPLNQMFVLLKADVLLHSQAGKEAWQQNYSTDPQMKQILTPHALDDAGAVCAAMIKAQLQDKSLNLYPLIDNYLDFILNKEYRLADGTFARIRPQLNTLWLDDIE